MDTTDPMKIPRLLIQRLAQASRVTVLTGAGISAESGVPTFRDAQTGLWAQYRAEELATPDAFRRNPRLVWEWYAWRRSLVSKAEPNPGHRALVEMESRFPQFQLITQNVDGLHQRAGSQRVLELHGNLFRTKCFQEDTEVTEWAESEEIPPRCLRCGGFLRPGVVWFEEPLPVPELNQARQASVRSEVFFSIGTSSMVYPAAALPLEARQAGAMVVEINPHPTSLSDQATFVLAANAGSVLPELVAAIPLR